MLRILDRLEEAIIAGLLAASTLLVFAAVLHRYTGSVPWIWSVTQHVNLIWSQELAVYMMIWMAKFGAAYGVRTGIHVGVDVLVRSLRPRAQRIFVFLALGSGAFFTGVVALLGVKFTHFIYETGQTSPDLELPMWIVYLAVPLGSSLMCFRFLQVMAGFLRTGSLPHPVHSVIE